MSKSFISEYDMMAREIHATAVSKGWWERRNWLEDRANESGPEFRNRVRRSHQIAALMLVVSELSEGVEGLRTSNDPDDKVPEFTAIEAELADAIIRIMDLGVKYNWRIAQALIAKAEMNKGRPHLHGGKIA